MVRRYPRERAAGMTRRCADLTNRLLTFSRRQSLQASVTDLAELVPTIVELVRRTLGERIEIALDIAEGVWPVFVDRSQFETALVNLAVNARDAMPGGGRLTIGVRNRPAEEGAEGAGLVEVAVADTGQGMAPDVLERVFEPFFTTKESGKGTGLGLSMIYGFAQQSGGRVAIESQPGEGTTVRLLLPRTEARIPSRSEAVSGPALPDFRAATVLVIDDDPHVRRVTVALLETLGYRAEEAADGASGLRALEARIPDLVILDFAMPGMNGAEVARIARERWPALPLVFASGHADTAAIESVAGEGAPVLRKPFRIEELQSILVSVLSQGTS